MEPLPASPPAPRPSSRAAFLSCLLSEMATILSPEVSATSGRKHGHTFALGSQPSSHQPCHGLPRPGGARPSAEMVVAVCGLLSWLGLQEVSQSSWPQRPSSPIEKSAGVVCPQQRTWNVPGRRDHAGTGSVCSAPPPRRCPDASARRPAAPSPPCIPFDQSC